MTSRLFDVISFIVYTKFETVWKVRQTLPGLRVGFENQLARLMASGRFDAEADLQVMESLLKMEGLS